MPEQDSLQILYEIKEDISKIKATQEVLKVKVEHLEEMTEKELNTLQGRYENLKDEVFKGPVTLHELYKDYENRSKDKKKFMWMCIGVIKGFLILIFRDKLGF